MTYKRRKEAGAVIIELLLVFPILAIILTGAFEISRLINYKNSAIQLSSQAANQVFRECTSERAILMSDCVQRVQREMTAFAMENFPDDDGNGASHVAITVYFNRASNPDVYPPQYQYTSRADASQFVGQSPVFRFELDDDDTGIGNKPIALHEFAKVEAAIGVDNARTIFRSTGFLVVAQAYLRYRKPATRMFAGKYFVGDYVTDYTVI